MCSSPQDGPHESLHERFDPYDEDSACSIAVDDPVDMISIGALSNEQITADRVMNGSENTPLRADPKCESDHDMLSSRSQAIQQSAEDNLSMASSPYDASSLPVIVEVPQSGEPTAEARNEIQNMILRVVFDK